MTPGHATITPFWRKGVRRGHMKQWVVSSGSFNRFYRRWCDWLIPWLSFTLLILCLNGASETILLTLIGKSLHFPDLHLFDPSFVVFITSYSSECNSITHSWILFHLDSSHTPDSELCDYCTQQYSLRWITAYSHVSQWTSLSCTSVSTSHFVSLQQHLPSLRSSQACNTHPFSTSLSANSFRISIYSPSFILTYSTHSRHHHSLILHFLIIHSSSLHGGIRRT